MLVNDLALIVASILFDYIHWYKEDILYLFYVLEWDDKWKSIFDVVCDAFFKQIF